MAYPGENEHKQYLDYVIEMQEAGQEALSKEEWRKTRTPKDSDPKDSDSIEMWMEKERMRNR